MKIAIIDTGIDAEHKKLKHAKISGISLKVDENRDPSDFKDYNGHGTAVASIIHKFIPEIELVGVKIFHKGLQTLEDNFIKAIEWCIEQKDIRIINMSIGVSEGIPSKKLTDICKKAHDNGIILVAACNNDVNFNAFPAAYPWVFGVASGQIKKSTEHGQVAGKDSNFIAKGSIQRVAWSNNTDKIVSGTSYATPHITGIIGTYLRNDTALSFTQIKQRLTIESDRNIKPLQQSNKNNYFEKPRIQNINEADFYDLLFNSKRKFPWIKDLLIFPVSEKEMQAFSLFPQQCIFNIREMADYPRIYSALNPDIKSSKTVERSIDSMLDKVDTLVMGYYQDSMWEGNIFYGNELVKKAIEKQKNFFLFDKVIYNYVFDKSKN